MEKKQRSLFMHRFLAAGHERNEGRITKGKKKEEARSAESAFKAIDDLLRGSGGGCSGSLERSSRLCTVAQPSDPILRESNALIAAGMF